MIVLAIGLSDTFNMWNHLTVSLCLFWWVVYWLLICRPKRRQILGFNISITLKDLLTFTACRYERHELNAARLQRTMTSRNNERHQTSIQYALKEVIAVFTALAMENTTANSKASQNILFFVRQPALQCNNYRLLLGILQFVMFLSRHMQWKRKQIDLNINDMFNISSFVHQCNIHFLLFIIRRHVSAPHGHLQVL
jgi:hypothetical protein